MILALCYLFYFAAATASPLQRRKLSLVSHGSGQIAFAFRVSLVVAMLGLLLPFFSAPELKGDWLHLFLLALTCGVFGAASIVSQYWAQKHVDAGLTALLSNLYTPVSIALATLLLHEGLTVGQFLGAVLLCSAIFVVTKKHRISKLRFDTYFMAMAASGITLGFTLTAERALINTTGLTTGTLMSWWSQVAGLGIAALLIGTKTTFTFKETLVTGGLRYLQLLSWVLLVYVAGNLSVVSVITTFKVVILFIFAAVILHEREDLAQKVIGSLTAVLGLLLMAIH